ncbi:MAG: hypothetical protein FIB05_07450, partial [Betaproteobacteria bacterium]|nr:hypothetical protein [Betaproteobacteria bacterium]
MKCDDIQIHEYLFTPTAPGCGAATPEMPSIPPRPPGTFAPWPSKGFYDELSAVLYVQDSYRCSTYAAGMCEDHGTQARSEYTIWSSWQGGIAATENKDYVWAAKFWAGDPPTCSSYQEFPFIMQRRTELACPPGYTSQFDAAKGKYFCYMNIVCDEKCRAGNPIHIGNAEKALEETDFVGGGPFALRIDRQYGHRRINQPFVDTASPVPMALGQGWRHGYERYLRVWGSSPARRALIVRPNGLYAWFFESASGWSGRKDEKGALVETKDGGGATIGWEYRDAPEAGGPNPIDEVYNASGSLLSLIDR